MLALAAIGDIRRFPTARHLVGYLGLHPTVRQSGNGRARHGRIASAQLLLPRTESQPEAGLSRSQSCMSWTFVARS
jgi:hypothetical protein